MLTLAKHAEGGGKNERIWNEGDFYFTIINPTILYHPQAQSVNRENMSILERMRLLEKEHQKDIVQLKKKIKELDAKSQLK